MLTLEKKSSFASLRTAKISWLLANNLPPLPVAPAQDPYKYHKVVKASGNRGEYCPLTTDFKPISLFTGKNPSYLDEAGKPHLINHQTYQMRMPSPKELKRWFVNPNNGVGTLGSESIYWIDLDVKQFESQEECDRAFNRLLARQPLLEETLLEKTHSGGYRIGVKVKQPVEFTNFCLEPGGVHVGECLGLGRFTVLAPTVGVSGNAYESINFPETLVEIEQINFIYAVKSKSEKNFSALEVESLNRSAYSVKGIIALEELGHDHSQNVLAGEDIKGDRSDSLTTAIREWAGWSNWCHNKGITITGTLEELAHYAGERLGIDSDRVNRILNTIDLESCQPAAELRGGDEACWRKVKRLERENQTVNRDNKDKNLDGGIPPNLGGNGDDGGNNGGGDSEGYLPERNNWNAPVSWNGELGYWTIHKRTVLDTETGSPTNKSELVREFTPKCNFDLEIERELSDAEGGGLLLQVKRSIDNRQRRVIIRSLDSLTVKDFAFALTRTYGKGIVCNLKNDQLGALLHTKLIAYRERGGETYTLADRIGQQDSGTWVFSDRQLTRTGEPTHEEKSQIVFNSNLGSEDKIFSPLVAPTDETALRKLVQAAHRFHGDSQIDAAIFTLGWAAACLHFQEIMKVEKHFPLLNLYGDPGSCKTVMAESALSLAGWLGGNGQFRKITESALYEHLKLCGSLPLCFDDPDKSPWLDGLIQGLYNAKPRVVRGNEQTPRTSLMLTTNHLVGDNKPSTLSRLIGVAVFSSSDGDGQAWDELVAAQENASGALPQLLSLGYPAAEVRKLSKELRSHLPHAHVRVADSIALVLWYASAVCRLSGFDETRIKHYAIANLCKLANDADSASDSLTDFLDKLSALHAQSLVGEWDCRVVKTREGFEGLALNMPSVWGKVDKVYNPPYSRRVIESQISASGGVLKSVQKFYRSEDEVKAYRRALVTGGNQGDNYVPPSPPEEIARKCVLIPIHLVKDFLAAWKDGTTSVTSELPSVTPELSPNGNSSNSLPEADLAVSYPSSYLFQKESSNSFKESCENFLNLDSRNEQAPNVEQKDSLCSKQVTESNEPVQNLDGVKDTASYLQESNTQITSAKKQVTEKGDTINVDEREVTHEEKNICDRDRTSSSPIEQISSPTVTPSISLGEDTVVTTSVRELEALDAYQVGDLVYDLISGWSGPIISLDGDLVIFKSRERGRVKRHKDIIKKGTLSSPSHHKINSLVLCESHLDHHQNANDFKLGQIVWTRITGELELAKIVEISDSLIQVTIGDCTYTIDHFDPYIISSAE